MAKLYVYGTLRPGKEATVAVKGSLYDLGWYPGVKLGGTSEVVCEPISVDDFARFDRYEGYDDTDHENSLYIRTPILDGFIYEFNRDVKPERLIESGDWLAYTKQKRGQNADL